MNASCYVTRAVKACSIQQHGHLTVSNLFDTVLIQNSVSEDSTPGLIVARNRSLRIMNHTDPCNFERRQSLIVGKRRTLVS